MASTNTNPPPPPPLIFQATPVAVGPSSTKDDSPHMKFQRKISEKLNEKFFSSLAKTS
jgi:tryptophanyl-tRNA synthetase